MEQQIQMSERFRVGALLAVVGGLLDAYTYLTRGRVFANAQTGNIVLLGVCLAERRWGDAVRYLVPVLAFVVGVLVAEWIKSRFKESSAVHWRQISVSMEVVVLLLVALLPHTMDALANISVSFVCAVQVESFRKVHGSAFATTMCTGNLRSGTEQLWLYLRSGQREHLSRLVHYGGINLCFIVGAALGAWLSGVMGSYAVGAACIPLLVTLLLMASERN